MNWLPMVGESKRGPERPGAPVWLRDALGEDLFITLDTVIFDGNTIDDAVVEHVLPKLRRVSSIRSLVLDLADQC
jgi:hypothetical protein